jgi:hypothetical protein
MFKDREEIVYVADHWITTNASDAKGKRIDWDGSDWLPRKVRVTVEEI